MKDLITASEAREQVIANTKNGSVNEKFWDYIVEEIEKAISLGLYEVIIPIPINDYSKYDDIFDLIRDKGYDVRYSMVTNRILITWN